MAARAKKKAKKRRAKKRVSLTLRKSVIGALPKQRAVVRSLGLRRMHQTVTHPDGPEVRGMIRKVSHLLDVEEER